MFTVIAIALGTVAVVGYVQAQRLKPDEDSFRLGMSASQSRVSPRFYAAMQAVLTKKCSKRDYFALASVGSAYLLIIASLAH
jgi:hypothetical protein